MLKAFVDTSVILRVLLADDELKRKAAIKLLQEAKARDISLHLLPVAVIEVAHVLDKVYKLSRTDVRDLVLAILNTPGLTVEMRDVFRDAITAYAEKNVKFADAVMAYWGMERGCTTAYTYDEKDFKRLPGLEVRKP